MAGFFHFEGGVDLPASTQAVFPMWQLALPHARFVSSPLAAELDLLHPERGLVHWKRAGQSLADFAVLKLSAPWQAEASQRLVEAYVRGQDLVALYAETADRLTTQVYWQGLEPCLPEVLGGLELRVAVRTELLDSRPRVLVGAEFPALDGPTAPAISDLQVFRPVGIELSYVQIVGPADFGGAQLLGGATSSSETELQFARLEKGVIRCCRVRGWWVARSSDERIAVELAEEFRVAPLPLTA
jgi:hypothetical protein